MTEESSQSGGILDAVHETARDLHDAGFIDKHRMAEYDALCLPSVPEYDSSGSLEDSPNSLDFKIKTLGAIP